MAQRGITIAGTLAIGMLGGGLIATSLGLHFPLPAPAVLSVASGSEISFAAGGYAPLEACAGTQESWESDQAVARYFAVSSLIGYRETYPPLATPTIDQETFDAWKAGRTNMHLRLLAKYRLRLDEDLRAIYVYTGDVNGASFVSSFMAVKLGDRWYTAPEQENTAFMGLHSLLRRLTIEGFRLLVTNADPEALFPSASRAALKKIIAFRKDVCSGKFVDCGRALRYYDELQGSESIGSAEAGYTIFRACHNSPGQQPIIVVSDAVRKANVQFSSLATRDLPADQVDALLRQAANKDYMRMARLLAKWSRRQISFHDAALAINQIYGPVIGMLEDRHNG